MTMANVHPDFEILLRFDEQEVLGVVETAIYSTLAEVCPEDKPITYYTDIICKLVANKILQGGSRADVVKTLSLDEGGWPGFAEGVAEKIPMVAREELAMAGRMAGRVG